MNDKQQTKEQNAKYYEEHFEEIILKKTAKDVEMLIKKDGFKIETVVINKYIYSELVKTIIKLGGKFYSVYWRQASIENQENYFESQLAIEVEKKKKVIETHEWVEINGE